MLKKRFHLTENIKKRKKGEEKKTEERKMKAKKKKYIKKSNVKKKEFFFKGKRKRKNHMAPALARQRKSMEDDIHQPPSPESIPAGPSD